VLIFDWQGERRILPLDSGMTQEQDAEWRRRLTLPARAPSPNPAFGKLSHPIGAVQRFGDGWLVGTNMGEWGGALFFLQEGRPPQELAYGDVQALLPTSAGVYALFGLAHEGLDEGSYRLITFSNDGPNVGEERALPGAPIAIAQHGGETFVAGGFGDRDERTWARVFGEHPPSTAAVLSACS
jgi:hypothetical protein